MNNEHKIKLFLVDDDALFLKLLEIEFIQHADFEIETFATGELCIENLLQHPGWSGKKCYERYRDLRQD